MDIYAKILEQFRLRHPDITLSDEFVSYVLSRVYSLGTVWDENVEREGDIHIRYWDGGCEEYAEISTLFEKATWIYSELKDFQDLGLKEQIPHHVWQMRHMFNSDDNLACTPLSFLKYMVDIGLFKVVGKEK